MNDPRFYVWKLGGKRPHIHHPNYSLAEIEATRLALENPKDSFWVIQLKAIVRKVPHPVSIECFRK